MRLSCFAIPGVVCALLPATTGLKNWWNLLQTNSYVAALILLDGALIWFLGHTPRIMTKVSISVVALSIINVFWGLSQVWILVMDPRREGTFKRMPNLEWTLLYASLIWFAIFIPVYWMVSKLMPLFLIRGTMSFATSFPGRLHNGDSCLNFLWFGKPRSRSLPRLWWARSWVCILACWLRSATWKERAIIWVDL